MIVHDEMHQTLAFGRRGLERDDVYVAIGERPAKLAESARPIFHVDAELLGGWHGGLPPLVFVRNAVARSCGIEAGAIVLPLRQHFKGMTC